MTYKFEKKDGVIYVSAKLASKHIFKMMLDTGVTTTTFDIKSLYMAGYSIDKKPDTGDVETANGIIEVNMLQVESLTAFGRTVHNMPIHAYDFLTHGIISDYDGLLGLDFFENTVFCIDMKNNTIEVKDS